MGQNPRARSASASGPRALQSKNKVLPPAMRTDASGDWFAQQESDWFTQQEQMFEQEQQMTKAPLMGAGPLAGQPQGSGRMGGAGNVQPGPGTSQFNLPDVGGFLKENLPLIGGTVASGAAAFGTGGMSLPAQLGIGASMGMGGAMFGHELRDSMNDVPDPPTGEIDWDMLKSGVTEGVLPEITGQAIGGGARIIGNVASRIGAAGRNSKLINRIANPREIPMSTGGREVGRQTQAVIDIGRKAAKAPLSAKYDELLQGPFGSARSIDVLEDAPDSFTVAETGPTNARRHELRSDALDDQRAAKRRDEPKQARRETAKAKRQFDAMEKAANDNGLSMDDYVAVNSAWAKVAEQYDNSFMKQSGNMKGSNFMDLLTNPKAWKSRKVTSELGGAEVPLDNPDLLNNLKANLDSASWGRLQTAVQKKIVRDSTDIQGNIVANRLAMKIRKMLDYGAKDLIPQHKELLDFAVKLDKGVTGLPTVGMRTGAVNATLKMLGLDTPSVGRRMNTGKAGWKGKGQKTAERLGALGASAAMADYTPGQSRNDSDIPDPPRR